MQINCSAPEMCNISLFSTELVELGSPVTEVRGPQQTLKMKLKVTTATASLLPLLLLSEITAVETYPLYGFTVIPNKKREASENCAEYKNISTWFDLQNAAANSLKKHNAYLDDSLGSKALKDCCFYDKDLMQLVIDNVHQIDKQNGIKAKKPLKSRGELGKDLNKIIPRIKRLVAKGFKSCCYAMEESLRKNKKDLQKEVEIIKHQFKSNASDEFTKDKKELEEKHKNLTDKLKDLKESLDKLENKEDMTKSSSASSCCSEINTKIETLENQIKAATTETLDKTNQFDNQLKEIENVLNSLKSRVKDAKTTLDSQGESLEIELEKCEKKFGKGYKNQDKTNNCCELCSNKLVPRIKKLKEKVISLINKLAKLGFQNGINLNINACLEDDKMMDNIKVLIDKSEKFKEEKAAKSDSLAQARTGSNNTTCSSDEKLKERAEILEQEVQELRKVTNKSQSVCENIDKLNTFAKNLEDRIDKMKEIYAEHMNKNKLELEDHKRQLNGTLTELDKINNNDEDFPKLKNLQEMLQKVQNELKNLESENLKDSNKLGEDLEKMTTESDKFWLEVDRRLTHLEGQDSKGQPDNATDAWNRLEKQYSDLNQDMDKAKEKLKSLQQLENLYNQELNRLKKLENQVAICLKACKEVPKMYALLKKVKDMMKVIKTKKSAKAPNVGKRSKAAKIQGKTKKITKLKKPAKNKIKDFTFEPAKA